MQQYQYDGPVMRFDDCVQHRWKATNVAPPEAKAKSNLAYRYKKAVSYTHLSPKLLWQETGYVWRGERA